MCVLMLHVGCMGSRSIPWPTRSSRRLPPSPDRLVLLGPGQDHRSSLTSDSI